MRWVATLGLMVLLVFLVVFVSGSGCGSDSDLVVDAGEATWSSSPLPSPLFSTTSSKLRATEVRPEISEPSVLRRFVVLTTPNERIVPGQGDRLLKARGWLDHQHRTSGTVGLPAQSRALFHVTYRAHEALWRATVDQLRAYPQDTWVSSFPFLSATLSHKGAFVKALASCRASTGVDHCGVAHPVSYYYHPSEVSRTHPSSSSSSSFSSLQPTQPPLNASDLLTLLSFVKRVLEPEEQRMNDGAVQPWVFKDTSQGAFGGRGMRVLPSTARLAEFLVSPAAPSQGLVQQYLTSPLLVDGFKSSPALYFLVTDLDPLRIYLFDVSTQAIVVSADPNVPPDPSAPSDALHGHVTNIDANHARDTFSKYDDDPTRGTLRSLAWYREHLSQTLGAERAELLLRQMTDQIVRSVMAALPRVLPSFSQLRPEVSRMKFYHLLRADFQISQGLAPFLFEINQIPLHDCDAGKRFYDKIPRWRCGDYDTYRDTIFRMTGILDDHYDRKLRALEGLLQPALSRPRSPRLLSAAARAAYHEMAIRIQQLPISLVYPLQHTTSEYDPLIGPGMTGWDPDDLEAISNLVDAFVPL